MKPRAAGDKGGEVIPAASLVQQGQKGETMQLCQRKTVFSGSISSIQSFKSSIEVVLQKIYYQRPLLELKYIFLIN